MTNNPTPHLDPEVENFDDFDAWRRARLAARGETKPVTVFGREVVLPTGLPLGWTIEMETAAASDDPKIIRKMVGVLYGDDALDWFIEAGCTTDEFEILLAFGFAHADGKPVSFQRAAELVAEANEERRVAAEKERAEGKVPARKPPKSKAKVRAGRR